MKWWIEYVRHEKKVYYQDLPSIIAQELWMTGNNTKHKGKNMTWQRLVYNITKNLRMLLKVRKQRKDFPFSWEEILKVLEKLKARKN